MKKHFIALFCALSLVSVTFIGWKPATAPKLIVNTNNPLPAKQLLEKYVSDIYDSARLDESGLSAGVFKKALTGFINLKVANRVPQNSSVLTIVDYTKSSCQKRMWIIDVASKELLLNTWVAHGYGSGRVMASRFSDKVNSYKSSLGFYLTDEIYYGKHGRSLRLDGLDEGFNKNARAREIVVHAADYVGQNVIEEQGRLGCSQGCPAVAPEVAEEVINTIKDKTVLFIYGNSSHYNSKYLDEYQAANFLSTSNSSYLADL